MGRTLAATAVLVTMLATTAVASAETEPPPSSQPNVVLIVTDDQRDGLNVMPNTADWLFRNGRRYKNAFVTTPLCCPSRASILSGRYAHNHGVTTNFGGPEGFDFSATIQAYLQEAGYHTAIFGKLMNRWDYSVAPPGFDEFAIFPRGYYNTRWNVNGSMQDVSTYSTTFIQQLAVDFIRDRERNDDTPWMLYVTPYAPHKEWVAERSYDDAPVGDWYGNPAVFEKDLSDKPPWLARRKCDFECGDAIRRRQYRTLLSVDDMVGAVRDALERARETNTLVIYTSDNGMLWGEHGLKGKNQPYTPSSKVPFAMRWSGHVEPGRARRVVANIDIAPTILDAAEVTPPTSPPMDGRSLLTSAPRERILLEHWCMRWKCDFYASTRTRAYQYVERYDDVGNILFREYYDLKDDPWQLENLFRDGVRHNVPDLKRLHSELSADRACVGMTCP